MNVLQINAAYGHGSTGVIVRDIEKACEDAGIECFIASCDKNVLMAKHHYLIGNRLGRKTHAFLSRIAGKSAYYSFFETKNLINYIKSINPNVVHLHNLHNNYLSLNMLLKYLASMRIKTVVTLHDCWFFTGGCFHYTSANCNRWKYNCGHCPKRLQDTPAYIYDASSSILKDRIKYFSAIPDLTFVGVSKWITSELSKSHLSEIGKIECIHNGFDLETFQPRESNIRKQLNLENMKVILGPASKWLQPINKDTLNYFAQHLPSDYVLLLFGCSGKIKDLPRNVMTYGFTKNRKEMAELYSMADVMVNCSREDTLSSINIEAQACGTPVVTYDATGNAETVDGRFSRTVKTGDYEALLFAALSVKKNPSTIEVCRKFAETNYSKDNKYKEYIEMYKK